MGRYLPLHRMMDKPEDRIKYIESCARCTLFSGLCVSFGFFAAVILVVAIVVFG